RIFYSLATRAPAPTPRKTPPPTSASATWNEVAFGGAPDLGALLREGCAVASRKSRLSVERLEEREVPAVSLVAGAGAGTPPFVGAFNKDTTQRVRFPAYHSNFLGGVPVAKGDVTRDAQPPNLPRPRPPPPPPPARLRR